MHEEETMPNEITVETIRDQYMEAVNEVEEYIAESPNDVCRQLAIAAKAYVDNVLVVFEQAVTIEESDLPAETKRINLIIMRNIVGYCSEQTYMIYNKWESEFTQFKKREAALLKIENLSC